MVRQQTWQESKTEISSRRRWTADVGIASAISKPGVFARRHVQAIKLRQVAVTAAGDRILPCTKRPDHARQLIR